MKLYLVTLLSMIAAPAMAHTGHVTAQSGHDHMAAYVAVGAAALAALYGVLRARAA